MLRPLLLLILGTAVYGFSLGSAHSWLYAQRNLIKLPLLILGTGLVCGAGYRVVAAFIGANLKGRDVADLVLTLFQDLGILLASLSPPTFFYGRVLVATDDSRLGEYGLFLGLNVGFVAICGILALLRQSHLLFESAGIGRARSRVLVIAWLAMTLFVGGQGAFYLRPIFGRYFRKRIYMRVLTHKYKLPHSEGIRPAVRLRYISYYFCQFLLDTGFYIPAVNPYTTPAASQDAYYILQQSRLSRTIRPDNRKIFASFYVETHGVKDITVAERI